MKSHTTTKIIKYVKNLQIYLYVLIRREPKLEQKLIKKDSLK